MDKLLFAIGLCFLFGRVYTQDDCDPIVVDECGYQLYDSLMDPSKMPQNQADLDSYCETLKAGQNCVREKLKKCPTLLPTAVANAYIDAVGFSIEDVCKPGGNELGKKLLPYSPCVREKLTDFSCTKDFFKKVEAAPLEEKSQQMEAACCAFLQYDRCYNDEVKAKCGNKAGRSVRSIIQGFGLFLVDRCLPFLAEPEKCKQRVAKALPTDHRVVKSILPGLTQVIANNVQAR